MSLENIRWHIRSGLYHEARKLIDKEQNIDALMNDAPKSEIENENLPLLVMISLIKDEENALSLSRLLIEKGYHIELCDPNGLCALNYAIALQRKKLLNLMLNSFQFELNNFRDKYKNSFFHYVYATNNQKIIEQFTQIYSKYYEFSPDMFKKLVNCDGLSVQDLLNYCEYVNQRQSMRKLRLSRAYSITNLTEFKSEYKIPRSFNLNSNPIVICKYINQVFNSNSTMKTDLIFVINNTHATENVNNSMTKQKLSLSNQANMNFKLNILYQIKSLNKPNKEKISAKFINDKMKNNRMLQLRKYTNSSMSNPEHVKTNEKYVKYAWNFEEDTEYQYYKFDNNLMDNTPANWRGKFYDLFDSYSTIHSPSYRPSSAMIMKLLNLNKENEEKPSTEGVSPDGSKPSGEPTTSTTPGLKHSRTNISPTNENKKPKSPHQQMAKVDNYLVPGSLLKTKR